jgi:hypothetical protein
MACNAPYSCSALYTDESYDSCSVDELSFDTWKSADDSSNRSELGINPTFSDDVSMLTFTSDSITPAPTPDYTVPDCHKPGEIPFSPEAFREITEVHQWQPNPDVEVRWITEEGTDAETASCATLIPDIEKEDMDVTHNLRCVKLLVLALLAGLVMAAVVFSIHFTKDNTQGHYPVAVGLQNLDEAFIANTTSSSRHNNAAINPPMVKDWKVEVTRLARGKVLNALSNCTNTVALLDNSTDQGKAYEMLWTQVRDTARLLEDGMGVQFDPIYTNPKLLEAYSLLMLYITTSGPDWTISTNWGYSKDPCTWYGARCIDNSGVERLTLGRFTIEKYARKTCMRADILTILYLLYE